MQLRDAGKLNLDDPIEKYVVPSSRSFPLTVEHTGPDKSVNSDLQNAGQAGESQGGVRDRRSSEKKLPRVPALDEGAYAVIQAAGYD